MAYISRLSENIYGGVAQDTIVEGSWVVPSTSGIRGDLRNVQLAASGTTYPAFIAIVPPDNFGRPTNKLMYTATFQATIRADVNTGWSDPVDNYTIYRKGLSSFEAPVLASGMLCQLIGDNGTVTLTSGNIVDSANIKVPGALVKPADDGTGRTQYTAVKSEATGYVEQYDATRGYLTIVIKQ